VAFEISELSVFLPTYNEGEIIKKVVLHTREVLVKVAERWELIIVNDGSSDDTKKIVEGIKKEDGRIKLINHGVNKGYGATLATGLYSSRYSWIAFTDSDGQFDFSEIENKVTLDLIRSNVPNPLRWFYFFFDRGEFEELRAL